jgi:hypothetical protein
MLMNFKPHSQGRDSDFEISDLIPADFATAENFHFTTMD